MNKNVAQLMDDYGKNIFGTIDGTNISVDSSLDAGPVSIIATKDSDGVVTMGFANGSNIGGVPIEMPAGDLVNSKVYNLVYNSTKEAFVLTAAN